MVSKSRLLVSTVLASLAVAGAAYAQPASNTSTQASQNALSPAGPGPATPQTQADTAANRQGANQTAENPGGDANVIAEVVVTAEKREQSLQQVPLAITAFTQEKRDLIGIQSVVDQTNYTPGLTYQPALDRLSLRGVGRLSNSHSVDSGTAIYVDGVFTTSTFEAGRDPMFIERTEILRGPQGTLYGRNAIGGAYNVISKRPSKEFSGEGRFTIANYDRQEVAGRFSLPLNDNLRLGFGYQKILQGDGFVDNISGAPGLRFTTTDGVRDQDYFEFQLAGEVGKLDFWAYYGKNQWNDSAPPGTVTNGGTFAPPEINPYVGSGGTGLAPIPSFGFTGGLNTQFFGPVRGNPALVTGDPFKAQTNVAFKNTVHENDIFRTQLAYHFNDFDVKYIGGFTRYNYFYTNDTDQTSITSYQLPLSPTAAPVTTIPTPAGPVGVNCFQLQAAGACSPLTVFPNTINTYNEDEEFYSHEFNIASTWDKPLQYIAGLYYYHEKFQYPIDVFQPQQTQLSTPLNASTGTAAAANPQRLLLHNNTYSSISSKAAFVQVDYKIFGDFKLTGGLRYTNDEKKAVEEQRAVCFVVCTVAASAGGLDPARFGSLIGTNPAIPPSVDVTLSQGGFLPGGTTLAQLLATGQANGAGQQGVIGYSYDRASGNLRRSLRGGFNAVTGTAGLEWTPDRRTLAYFKYSRGYKAGAFNTVTGAAVGLSGSWYEVIEVWSVSFV